MIPVFDLGRQNKIIGPEIQRAIGKVIKSGVFILGPEVAAFETEFAEYIGVKYAVGVASGTDAITLALLSEGVGPGDEVILPANSYPSVFAVTAIGAVPKLVDVDPSTFNIDPAKIPGAIGKKTKAILPVHLYGQPADMEKILQTGEKYKIPVIEDCAQAHGAEIIINKLQSGPVRAGSLGVMGCFSFYPTKNLGGFGDGGVVVTDNPELYEKVKLLRMYGERGRYESVIPGRNSRLDEVQAAILRVKLKYLDGWIGKRREIADKYRSLYLKAGPAARQPQNYPYKGTRFGAPRLASLILLSTDPVLPVEAPYGKHTYHLFVIRSEKRDQLKKFMEKKGIGTGIHYPAPIHLVPSFRYLGYKQGDFPQSEKAAREILSLPMFPELTGGEVEKVTEALKEFCR